MPEIVQYYLVDAGLNMRKGKIAAQCAHGALLAHKIYQRIALLAQKDPHDMKSHGHNSFYLKWEGGDSTKIVLKATAEELKRANNEYRHMAAIVVDRGYTEVPANTTTVVVLPVMLKDGAPEWIKNLPLL